MKIKSFKDKLVYIFGASEGIGKAIALELLLHGARVVIFSRSKKKLDAAKKDLTEKTLCPPEDILSMILDVTKPAIIKKQVGAAIKNKGIPDIVINNVGRAIPDYFENISIKQLKQTFEINIESMWNTLSFLLPKMKTSGGYIVNVSSMAGFIGVFGYSDYAVTKYGIIGLTEVLRSEYKKYNISFSVLCPPDTITPGYQKENKTKPAETIAVSQGIKPISAETVAKSCLRGIQKNQFIINTNFMAKLTYLLKRFLPGLLFMITDSDVKRAEKNKK